MSVPPDGVGMLSVTGPSCRAAIPPGVPDDHRHVVPPIWLVRKLPSYGRVSYQVTARVRQTDGRAERSDVTLDTARVDSPTELRNPRTTEIDTVSTLDIL